MAEYHISESAPFNDRLGVAGASRATDGDVCFIESDIAASAKWMPGTGVQVIGNKSPSSKPVISANGLDNSGATSIKPDRVLISNLELVNGVQIFDPRAFVMSGVFLHGSPGDGVGWRGHDYDNISGEMIHCRLKDINNDGIDLHVSGSGAAANVARSRIGIKNCLVYENIGTVSQPDQAVTPHDQGTMVVDGGVFASNGLTAMGPATAVSPLILRNARITGKVQAHLIDNCNIDSNGQLVILFTDTKVPRGAITDSRITNTPRITFQNTQGVDCLRNIITQSSANQSLLLYQQTGVQNRVEACVLVGNGGSSNRAVQGNTGSAMELVWWNNLAAKFGICIDLSISFWASADIWNSLWLGTTSKFSQTATVPIKTGRFNYYDVMPTDAGTMDLWENPLLTSEPVAIAYTRGDINNGRGHITSGDGAAAANFRDYANNDFRPVLPVPGVDLSESWYKLKDWGDPTMATIPRGGDVDGVPYNTNCAGPYSAQNPRFHEVLRTTQLMQV